VRVYFTFGKSLVGCTVLLSVPVQSVSVMDVGCECGVW